MTFEMMPRGPFDLATSNQYFGGWITCGPAQASIAMAFPVEGWYASAAVILRQDKGGAIMGDVHGAGNDAEKAWQQALSVLSLDCDGAGWPEIGQRDPVIGNLQHVHHFLRPVLFHSPYEAAAAFIIGHRISIKQGRAIRQEMAQAIGDSIQAGETTLYAFPRPQALLELTSFKGINAEKIERLHGIALSALDGHLDRGWLRSLPVEQALTTLRSLRGVGQFFSQGILLRGAGLVDDVSDDAMTKEAVQLAYQLSQPPNYTKILQQAENWRPYRMWASVLLHVWLRCEAGGPLQRQAVVWRRNQLRRHTVPSDLVLDHEPALLVAQLAVGVDLALAQVADHVPVQAGLVDAARFGQGRA